jgi:hypothetical protein
MVTSSDPSQRGLGPQSLTLQYPPEEDPARQRQHLGGREGHTTHTPHPGGSNQPPPSDERKGPRAKGKGPSEAEPDRGRSEVSRGRSAGRRDALTSASGSRHKVLAASQSRKKYTYLSAPSDSDWLSKESIPL